jgi:hypothetical protein
MSKTTKWIIGIVLAVVILQFAMPFVWHLIYPTSYGMTLAPDASAGVRGGFGFGSRMPMMGNGFGMHPMMGFGFGGFIMWLLPVSILVLVVLGIVYLWKKINEKPAGQSTEQ